MIADDLRHDAAGRADDQQEGNKCEETLARLRHGFWRGFASVDAFCRGTVVATQPCLHHRRMHDVARVEPLGGTVMIERHSTPLSRFAEREGTSR